MLRDRGDRVEGAPACDENEGVVEGQRHAVWLVDARDERMRVGVQHVRTARARWPDKKIVLVAHGGCTPYLASRVRGEVADDECRDVEVFATASLHVDLPRHVLVPEHRVVGPDELARELRTHGLRSADCLPKLLAHDPVARWYAWPPGTVVRVVRDELQDSGIVLQCEALRVVV